MSVENAHEKPLIKSVGSGSSGSGFRVWSMMLLVGIALFCCGVFSAWAADDLYLGIEKGINYWCGLVMLNLAMIGAWLGYRMARPNTGSQRTRPAVSENQNAEAPTAEPRPGSL